MRKLLCVLIVLVSNVLYAQPEVRPDPLDPSYHHDRWGISPSDQIREYRAYKTSFDGPDDNDGDGTSDTWAIPEWVAYEMHSAAPHAAFEDRPSTWMTDKSLFLSGIAPDDASYKNSGFDRGHMCMREHARRLGKDADWNTHNVLNACPQHHEFNAGIWLGLENKCSTWADAFGKIWVICGPIMKTNGQFTTNQFIGDAGEKPVAVPHSFYKIVIRESGDDFRPHVLAFIYPHDPNLNSSKASVDHTPFLRSVRDIEDATGLDFFTSLSQTDQNAIEAQPATSLWTVAHPFALAPGLEPEGPNESEVEPAEPGPSPQVQVACYCYKVKKWKKRWCR